jgi:hypothetical protein
MKTVHLILRNEAVSVVAQWLDGGRQLLRSIDLTGVERPTILSERKSLEDVLCVRESGWLESVRPPLWIERIRERTFDRCPSLVSVNLGECESLACIGIRAFRWCISLREMSFPSSLAVSEYRAFQVTWLEDARLAHVTHVRRVDFTPCARLTGLACPMTFRGACDAEGGGSLRILTFGAPRLLAGPPDRGWMHTDEEP